MKNRFLIVGDRVSKICDLLNIDFDLMLGVEADFHDYHYEVILDKLSNVIELLPLALKKFKNNYQGVYNGNYYTIYMEYGLIGITDTNNDKCYIGLKENLYSRQSFYLIRSVVNKHVNRLVYKTYVPLHAGGILTRHKTSILFTGTKMSGKSTLTKYFCDKGNVLLNDDLIVFNPLDVSVAGFSEGFYIRPDALIGCDKNGIKAFKEIAPGRKFFMDNPNRRIYNRIKTSCVVLLDRDFGKSFKSDCSRQEALDLFMRSQSDCYQTKEEYQKLSLSFYLLWANSRIVYTNLQSIDALEVFLHTEEYL